MHVGNVTILRHLKYISVAVPGEFTTMAGRVLREAIRQELREHGEFKDGTEPQIVLAGLSNLYTHYITTEEEYDAQVSSIYPFLILKNI